MINKLLLFKKFMTFQSKGTKYDQLIDDDSDNGDDDDDDDGGDDDYDSNNMMCTYLFKYQLKLTGATVVLD